MDVFASPSLAPSRALSVCGPRDLQLWDARGMWPPPARPAALEASASEDTVATAVDDEDDEDAESSGSASARDEEQHVAIKEEVAHDALRAMATHESPRKRGPIADKPKKKRQFKKRKPTHTVRKEEKASLLAQIDLLQAQLGELKFQALVEQGEAAKSVTRQEQANLVLRESIEHHHVAFARVQSLISRYVQQNIPRVHPTKTPIVLGLDRFERHRTLMAMKDAKLDEAWRFLTERCRYLDPTTAYYEEERYNTPEGDYCVVRFDVVPLIGVPSLEAVFHALRRAMSNAEIIISEISGNITIREDDDHGEASLMQARLVSTNADGSLVESNTASFSEYYPDGDYSVIAGDYIDEDALYPYRPHERVRRDATHIMTLTPHYIDRRGGIRPGEVRFGPSREQPEDGKELVVVLRRWAFWKFLHTDLPISGELLGRLRDNIARWGEIMLDCIRQSLVYGPH